MTVVGAVGAAAAVVAIAALLATRDSDNDSEQSSPGGDSGEVAPPVALQDPAAAFQDLMELTTSGQFGRLYDLLHPAQQAIIDRNDYIRCAQQELEDDPEFSDVEVHVTETYPDTILVPGTDERDEVTAVVAVAELTGQQATDTAHLAEIDGTWRWIEDEPENYRPSTDPFDTPPCVES